ncbi:P-loop containing nucleoside triphosphate hydrolase protein [Paraphoma chrysanthemicola]|uniref:P-loop containing nucleoside triphosphate hydrolase protein n=1 Tax=Paraphoma chrysanthemicola TaxID=798071 RepID=A0A8K0RJX7_9PLEO|nr:P-loop containing nucleoside triphosphate hydrolase protein [Paraphoma chrysanthemicola]
MRANTTQKAYDEAFLACSTAVYFEGQNNEKEALRSWKTALDHIYYHNARRNPTTYRPTSSTEKALFESLRQLELQCKERVDLLEALKKSREDSKESLASSTDANAPTPPPHSVPVTSSDTNGSSSWLGGGSIPPMEYADLSRPPPLPRRPVMAPRKSSGTGSIRENDLIKTMSASTLSPETAGEKKSRTPSPEKKGRMLRTLRPGRDGKPASKMPNTLRSRPEASKAATQAWSFGGTSNNTRPSLGLPQPSTSSLNASARSSLERPASERPSTQSHYLDSPQPQQPQAPFYFKAGEGSASTAYTAPPMGSGTNSEPVKVPTIQRTAPPPVPRKSVELGRVSGAQATPTALPSYRKEYPTPALDARVLAASAAARSYGDYDDEKNEPPQASRPVRRAAQSSGNNARSRNARGRGTSEPIALTEEEDERKHRPPATRKGRARGDSIRADLPPTPTSEPADSEEEIEESDEWKKRTDEIMKNLPRGVDKQAAQQILNEIVIQGDEVHWDDVAGLEIAKSALKETVVYPFLRPDLFMGLREPARGMLLFGPPGTGKTMLARAVATESKSTFFAISASSLTSKFLGESEKLVRALFQLAKMLAPSIIFVDEIDSLLSSRSGSGEHEATRRIKTEFLIQWSDLQKAAAGRDMSDKEKEKGDATRVLVLAATNLPWAIDEAARRRFVRRQYIPLPEDWVRKKQVETLLSHQKHGLTERDLDRLVRLTEGFSGSDITALAKDAAMGPLRSLGEKLLSMTMDQIRPIQFQDFQASLATIRPSVSKEGLKQFEDWSREFGERGG